MARFILTRMGGLAGVLLVVSALTFGLMHAVPGGPFDARTVERQQAIPPEIKRQLNAQHGFDQPIWRQYLLFLRNALRLDFGYSLAYPGRTVAQIFREQWPYSVQLGLLTLAWSLLAGVGLGLWAAIKPNSWVDYTSTALGVFCLVMPAFVLAILLQFVFAVRLGWFPTGGWTSPRHWVLPVLANSLGPILVLLRHTRASVSDTLHAAFVRTARAKGLSQRRIILVHVLKNALTPLLTVGGPLAAGLITGSFFVESMFRIPGIGFYFVTAIQHRDYPLIMATTLVWTTIISLAYLFTDVLYALVDPRVKIMSDE